MNISCSTNICDENQVEVRVTIDGEPDPSFLHTGDSSEGNWNNSSFVLSNLQESRLSKIKVLQRRVAPATIVVSQCKVRGAEVCGSNDYATGEAPFGVSVTFHLIARPATHAIVE